MIKARLYEESVRIPILKGSSLPRIAGCVAVLTTIVCYLGAWGAVVVVEGTSATLIIAKWPHANGSVAVIMSMISLGFACMFVQRCRHGCVDIDVLTLLFGSVCVLVIVGFT